MQTERVCFASHPSSFRIRCLQCDNLECSCTAVTFQLVEARRRDRPSAMPLRISIRVDVPTWEEVAAPPRSAEIREIVAEFLRDYPPLERESLKQCFRDRRRIVEQLDQCLADPEDVETGRLIGFDELTEGLSETIWDSSLGIYIVEWEGSQYHASERYCLNPDCDCRKVYLSFFYPSSRKNSRGQQIFEEHFQVLLKLDGSIQVDKVYHGDRSLAERVMAKWEKDYRRNLKYLRWRYDKMKEIGRRSLEAACEREGFGDEPPSSRSSPEPFPPPTPPIRRLPGRVGRNEPCPCGSGKKYKKCCGRGGDLDA
jgi:hypothetical protein